MIKTLKKISMRNWLVLVFIAVLPFERLLTREFFGYTLKLSYLFGAIIILFGLYLLIVKKISRSITRDEIWLSLFGILALLTNFWSIDAKRSVVISLSFVFMIALFYFLRRMIDEEIKRKVISLIIVVGFLASIFALWQFFVDKTALTNLSFLRQEYRSQVFGFPRVQSTFLEPLFLANFLLIPIFLNIYLTIKQRPHTKVIPHLMRDPETICIDSRLRGNDRRGGLYNIGSLNHFFLLITATAFFLTLSRGAFLALAAGLIMFYSADLLALIKFLGTFFRQPQKAFWVRPSKFDKGSPSPKIVSLIIIIVSFGLAVLSILSVGGREGLSKYFGHATVNDITTGESVLDRKDTMSDALNESRYHLFGVGAGAFGALPKYQTDIAIAGYQTVNNQYLEILVEEGVLGLFFFILFVICYLTQIIKNKDHNRSFFAMTIGLVTAILIQYLFLSTFYIIYVWVILAIISPKQR